METRYLRTLVVTIEAGSFSRAAEILHLTQSAISQRVKTLEERYGYQLFDRSGSSLALTEPGRLVMEKAKTILKVEQELLEGLKSFSGLKQLSLCCTPTFGSAYLPSVLDRFMRQNTDIDDLKFLFHQPLQALKGLKQGEFDLAVLEHWDGLDFSDFQTVDLPLDELVVVAAPRLNLPDEEVEVDELVELLLYARRDGCSSKELLRKNLDTQGKQIGDFSRVVITDDLRWTLDNVREGNGIAFMSRSLAQAELTTGALQALHVKGFDHFRQRTVIIHPQHAEDPLIQSFLQSVHAIFEKSPPQLTVVSGG